MDINGFIDEVLEAGFDAVAIEPWDIQELGVKYGLLKEQTMTEPCDEDCRCQEYGDFPLTCYRKQYGKYAKQT